MFRKSDLRKWQDLYPVPEWKQKHLHSSPSINERGDRTTRVTVIDQSCDEIAKSVLNPSEITLTRLIESGVTIDPSSVRNLLNLTDPADIEKFSERRDENLYNYMLRNKDEIFKLAGKVVEES